MPLTVSLLTSPSPLGERVPAGQVRGRCLGCYSNFILSSSQVSISLSRASCVSVY